MVNFIFIALGTILVTIIGGGIGYFVWMRSRPTKMFWNAEIYTLNSSIKPRKRNRNGELVSKIPLADLRPYTKDILQKVIEENGITICRLKNMNAPTPEPTSDSVELWGKDDRRVMILKEGDSYTIMEKGYDKESGELIFTPLPYETSTMLQQQVILRKSRIKQDKDVLAQITPWVVTGMMCLMLFAGTWLLTESYITLGEMATSAQKQNSEAMVESANIFREGALIYQGYDPEEVLKNKDSSLGLQDNKPDAIN